MKALRLASWSVPEWSQDVWGLAELPWGPVSHELVMMWIKPQVCHLKNGNDLRDLLVRVMVRGLNEMVQEVHLAQYLCEFWKLLLSAIGPPLFLATQTTESVNTCQVLAAFLALVWG